MAANANPNLFTMTAAAAAPSLEDPLQQVEVFNTSNGVVVTWGEGGAQGTTTGLSDRYTDDKFHAIDSDGNEPFRKTFGTLTNLDGGILTIEQIRY
eukprot:scaffold101581_cov24-Attheya_sp.AAC.1